MKSVTFAAFRPELAATTSQHLQAAPTGVTVVVGAAVVGAAVTARHVDVYLGPYIPSCQGSAH